MNRVKEIRNVFKGVKSGNFQILSMRIFSEENLAILSVYINNIKDRSLLVDNLISGLSSCDRNYDWNVGSILQHLDVDLIISSLQKIKLSALYNSIGLVWVLGEFKNINPVIIDFLYAVINNAEESDAWWRAAFSLEKLGIDEAVNLLKMSLKHKKIKNLDFYLKRMNDKRSIINILILSNIDNIEKSIYPKIKEIFLKTNNCETIINCCWLIGRLKLIDDEIYKKLLLLINHNNYELKYYTFFALQNNATENLRPIMEKSLFDKDPLIRKMAARGLFSIGNENSLNILEDALYKEEEQSVVSEISKAIYFLKNPLDRSLSLIEIKSCKSENGMISDESDKWYSDPAIYNIFSEAEDPENICFSLISKKIKHKKISNPIDLATGTGRMMWQIIDNIEFDGNLYGVDSSKNMCEYISKRIKRERKYTSNVKVITSSINKLSKKISVKSDFIISSFGFPSKISDYSLCIQELRSVYSLLSNDGIFLTIGWDETFNDELSKMWFKYIPDKIYASNFEEWRKKRMELINSPRNCGLSWFKKGISAPLQFSSLKESAHVMGYLFGRDAAQYVVKSGKIEWIMSMGITLNTKSDLKKILKKHEGNRNFS